MRRPTSESHCLAQPKVQSFLSALLKTAHAMSNGPHVTWKIFLFVFVLLFYLFICWLFVLFVYYLQLPYLYGAIAISAQTAARLVGDVVAGVALAARRVDDRVARLLA